MLRAKARLFNKCEELHSGILLVLGLNSMIDKQDFYHGAALIPLLKDPRCTQITASNLGYIINDSVLVVLKYSTKSRSPWRFSFSNNEVVLLLQPSTNIKKVSLVFICGGDGICAISLRELQEILGDGDGWISAKRNFREQYEVAGPSGILNFKVSLQRWPSLVFEG